MIVGAGYVGLEMAEGLTARGIAVTQVEMLPEVLPTVDPELGAPGPRRARPARRHRPHPDDRHNGSAAGTAGGPRLQVDGRRPRRPTRSAGMSTWCSSWSGSDPTPTCSSGPAPTPGRAARCWSTRRWRPGCRRCGRPATAWSPTTAQLGATYLPLGTTAHKQGRVAGENAIGGRARFAGSLGTQVVKVFDLVAARTGLRDHEAERPATTGHRADGGR